MNFFEAQDRARRTTRRLIVVYALATLLIVLGVTAVVGFALMNFTQAGYGLAAPDFARQQAPVLLATAIITALFILGASLYKTARLSAGGSRVAADLGGTLVPADVQDPLRRRLRNVVEEISIASGVPVPEIFVLEQENGINAFAAGYAPGDAAIAVTRGALEILDRDELQGVIAHEFSHVLNGDMRLNIRLMGVLFGILVLGLIGRMIVRGGHHARIASSRRDRGTPVVLVVGLGLVVLGGIGVFFARVIKASVSRQREVLADASAVQFTRQTQGLADALKKIGGYQAGSYLQATDPEEVSHMLFGTGARLSGLFATHPPLVERIRALDPRFKESDYPKIDLRERPAQPAREADDARYAGFTTALARGGTAVLPDSLAELVGQPETEHVTFAGQLRGSIPEELYDAAHSTELSYLLAVALILDHGGQVLERQLGIVEERLGRDRAAIVRRYADRLRDAGREYRLPLLEIAFPALRRRPEAQLAYLAELAERLIEIDGRIDLYEYCFYRILVGNLGQAVNPGRHRARPRSGKSALRAAAIRLLGIVADYGHSSEGARQRAFATGIRQFGTWTKDATLTTQSDPTVTELDRCLDILLGLNSRGRETLLDAISSVVSHDHTVTVTEAELVRAICAALDCPLPPILVHALPESQRA